MSVTKMPFPETE